MSEGRFREDLFFRLRVVPIEVPALRERRDDIPILLSSYVNFFARTYALPKVVFGPVARRILQDYDWPGNIRELKNRVQYLTCLRLDRPVDVHDLPLLNGGPEKQNPGVHTFVSERPLKEVKRELVSRFEREYLEDALRQSNGNIAQAARASGKPRRAFFELMRKYDIKPADLFPSGTIGPNNQSDHLALDEAAVKRS